MRSRTSSSLESSCLALLFVTGAALLTSLLWPVMSRCTFMLFFLAILLSAWRGSHIGGVVATGLSLLVTWYFFLPLPGPQVFGGKTEALPAVLFLVVGLLISTFTAESWSSRRRLTETTATLDSIVQASPLAIIAIDTDGNVTTWNLAAERLFGWSAQEVLGRPNPIVPPGMAPEYLALRAAAAENGGFLTRETVRVKKDGSPVSISISTAGLRDGAGKSTGTMAVITDITEQKQVQERLMRLATAVDQAAESIVITDIDGCIQYVNPAFESTTGYTRDEALGQTPRILKSGKQDDEFYATLWDTLKRGEVWSGHFTNRKKDGTVFEEEATISPVRDDSGRVVNFVAVKRDTTKEVGLESQLMRAQKMEAIGNLAGGIAHDFNNLLTAIVGYSQLVMAKLAQDDPLREDIEEIEKAGHRASSLTSQLLAFSRKQVFQPKVLDLNALVTDLQKMLKRLIGEDIELVAVLDLDIGSIKADPGQLQQVITNLVVNARDAMPHGGRVTIETANVDLGNEYAHRHIEASPGPYVMIAISDTGCGMTEEVQSHIFEPFFTTKELGRGTGLGLSTVYGIVKQSGGYIWVYSEPDSGTTFKIYLPRLVDCVEETRESAFHSSLPRGTETLLLAEDEPAVRELAARVLRSHGYRVLEASNGSEALAALAGSAGDQIHLLVTDVVMPRMGGRDLAQKLSRLQKGLPVLYVSGYTDKGIVHNGVLEEGTPFLQKPFTPEALVRKVREVLDGCSDGSLALPAASMMRTSPNGSRYRDKL